MKNNDLAVRIGQWIRNAERNRSNAEQRGDQRGMAYWDGQITAYKDVIGIIA